MNKLGIIVKALALCLVMLAMTACSNAQTKQDAKDSDTHRLQTYQQSRQEEIQLIANLSAGCAKDANPGLCLVALSSNLNNGLAAIKMPEPTPVPESPGWRIADNLTRGLTSAIPFYFNYRTTESNNRNFQSIVSSVAGSSGVHVGGDYISGTQTNVGHDYVTGTQTNVGHDQITGDRNNNTGQQDSPTFTNSGNCSTGSTGAAGSGATGGNADNGGTAADGGAGGPSGSTGACSGGAH